MAEIIVDEDFDEDFSLFDNEGFDFDQPELLELKKEKVF